jgi:two-component system sensor histidine kinase CpxA
MNSLFAKILLWFWFALAITVVGSAFISALNVNENDRDERAPVARLVRFELEEAISAYEIGGRPALQSFLDTLHRVYDARGVLTDENGRDLLTNEDRSDLILRARRRVFYQVFRGGDSTVARSSDDGRFWFFFIVPRVHVGSWFLQPEHIFVMAAAIGLCYWLALYLTGPVRILQKAVERFGRGDLSARAESVRRDELGQLARTFDRMADRIETLLAAERRLLLDISHELRSPLARLGVAIELARSGEDTDAALNRIQKESDRLNSLVGQLLQVTRVEGDAASLHRDPVRLDQLVQLLVEDSAIEAAAHGCGIQYQSGEAVTIAGDPELLRRAVENVLRNAIRYEPRASSVEVRLRHGDSAAVVEIRDHGPGVPEDALPHIFDPFYRVESDRNRLSGGIGLGLSIARRAVELHQGAIRATNADPGLKIELEFPAGGRPETKPLATDEQ